MMKFGKKGMSGESKGVVAILMIFGIIFVVAFAFTFFSQGGGPPTGPDAVIKYYDDLLKGEYAGKKYSPTSLVICLFIPLITTFSILWALIRIIPVFKQRENRPAASVLAMGLSLYVIPTMSWMIMQVFPPLIGVSAILIGVTMLIMAVFILVSTIFQFGDLKWGGKGIGGGGDDDYDKGIDRDTLSDWKKAGVAPREALAAQDRINNEIIELDTLWNDFLNHKVFKRIVDAVNEGRPLSELDIDFLEKAKSWLNDYLNKIDSVKRKLSRPGVGTPFWRTEVDANIEVIEKSASMLLGKLQGKKPGDKLDLDGAALRRFIETGQWLNREIERLPGLGRPKYVPGESENLQIPEKFRKDFDINYDRLRHITDKFYAHFIEIKPRIIKDIDDKKYPDKTNQFGQLVSLINDYIGLYDRGGLKEALHSPDNFKKLILEEPNTNAFKETSEIGILKNTRVIFEHIRPLYLKLIIDGIYDDAFYKLTEEILIHVRDVNKIVQDMLEEKKSS